MIHPNSQRLALDVQQPYLHITSRRIDQIEMKGPAGWIGAHIEIIRIRLRDDDLPDLGIAAVGIRTHLRQPVIIVSRKGRLIDGGIRMAFCRIGGSGYGIDIDECFAVPGSLHDEKAIVRLEGGGPRKTDLRLSRKEHRIEG